MSNLDSSTIGEHGILAMTARMMMEVEIRSFLIWCFEKYGEKMKFKHHNTVFKVSAVDELGYVTGIDSEGNEVHLHSREIITSLPTKAFRFFKEEWLEN